MSTSGFMSSRTNSVLKMASSNSNSALKMSAAFGTPKTSIAAGRESVIPQASSSFVTSATNKFKNLMGSSSTYGSAFGMSSKASLGNTQIFTDKTMLSMSIGAQKRNGVATSAIPKNTISFSVSGTAAAPQDNYIDRAFAHKKARRSTALFACNKEHVGSWGKRKYVVGGNWKSNGDWSFVNSFPEQTLNKAEFDPEHISVIVAPTLLHLYGVKQRLKDSVHVMAQDVSQYKRGAYTGAVTAD